MFYLSLNNLQSLFLGGVNGVLDANYRGSKLTGNTDTKTQDNIIHLPALLRGTIFFCTVTFLGIYQTIHALQPIS